MEAVYSTKLLLILSLPASHGSYAWNILESPTWGGPVRQLLIGRQGNQLPGSWTLPLATVRIHPLKNAGFFRAFQGRIERGIPSHFEVEEVFFTTNWGCLTLNISSWEEKNISPTVNGTLESMIFLFPWWDMLVPWRVSILDKLHHPLVAQFCNKHSREDDIQYTIDWTTCPPLQVLITWHGI